MKKIHLSNKRAWRKNIALIPMFIAAICVFSATTIAQNTVIKSWGGIMDANTIAGWGNSEVTATKQGDGATQLKVVNDRRGGLVESEFYTVNFDRDPEMVIWVTGASSTTESSAGEYFIKMTTGKNPAGYFVVGNNWFGGLLGSIQPGSRGQKLVIPLKPLRASKLTGTDIVKIQLGFSMNLSGASTYMNIKNIEMRYATVRDWDKNYLAKDIVDLSEESLTPYVQMVGGTAGFVVDGTSVGEAVVTYGDYLVDFDYNPVVKLDIDTKNTTGLVMKIYVDGFPYEMTGKMPVEKLQSQMAFNIKNLRTHTVLTGIHTVKIGIGTFKNTPGDAGKLSLRSMDFTYASTVKATATYIAPQLSGTRTFVTVNVQSFKEDPIPVTVIASLYDGVYESKGIRLLSSVTENISVSKDNPEVITVKLPVPKGTDIKNATVKTFVLNGGNPVTATATQISGYPDKIRAVIDIDAKNKEKDINKELFGIFLEDISRALDGGLNAQLVQNLSFEYSADDTYSRNSVQKLKNTPLFAWRPIGNVTLNVNNATPMNSNNTHYLEFTNKSGGLAGVLNTGYTNNITATADSLITQAMVIKAGETYEFSFFINTTTVKPFTIRIIDAGNTKVYAEAKITPNGAAGWKKYNASLVSNASDNNARLAILTQERSMIKMDMISLMPAVTFMGHGMRKDLAQVLADMKPAFMRFPGGGLVTGDYNLGPAYHFYHWKETVGPLEQRVSRSSLWGYNQSYQIGFYEFFQFCEDIGAEPLPCIPMGQGYGNAVPMSEMQKYVDDALDLVEFAIGDPNTNQWAKLRADMGHPQPFGLKYIELGNEQKTNYVFKERHSLIADALRAKYPELIIIGNSGASPSDLVFEPSWAFALEGAMDIVDEHAYRQAPWFIDGYNRFDTYDPNGPKVFFGEYAVEQYENYYSALAEAIFMMGFEKNADIVHLAAFAPLLVKHDYVNWGAAIRFDNSAIVLSPSYYVQKMFCSNNGTQTLANNVKYSLTSTEIDKKPYVTTVYDEVTKDIIVKIVNLNDKAIETTVNISNANISDGTASFEVLQTDNLGNRNTFANPDRITPYTEQVNVSSNQIVCTAKPYSLNIIRIKTNENKFN